MDNLSGVMNLRGWQWLFLSEGIPSILVGIWVIYYLDSSIEEAKWLAPEEKALLANDLAAEDKHKTEHRLIDAFRSGKVWVLCAIYFTLMVGLYGIAFWLPTIVKAFGIKGYFGVGLITAIPYGVAVVGMMILSYHSDKTGERRLHYVLNVTAGAVGLVLSGIYAANPVLSIIFLSFGTLGVIGSMPLFWPIPSAFLARDCRSGGHWDREFSGQFGRLFRTQCPHLGTTHLFRPICSVVHHCGTPDDRSGFDLFLYTHESACASRLLIYSAQLSDKPKLRGSTRYSKTLRKEKLMDGQGIIAELKSELHRIDNAIAALDGGSTSVNGMPREKRTHGITPAGRKRLSEMMKQRWAERRKHGTRSAAKKTGKGHLRRRRDRLTPAGRRKLSLMMKKRWAERRKQQKA